MSRDLTNKDNLNKQLKNKIYTLETEFESMREEYNQCVVSRDSLQQQKNDVERELKVIFNSSSRKFNLPWFHFNIKVLAPLKNIYVNTLKGSSTIKGVRIGTF